MRLAVLALALLTGSAWAAPIATDPQTVIVDRQNHMEEFNAAMKGLGEQIMSKVPDRDAVRDNALIIHDLAQQIPVWFPAGSGPEAGVPTKATAAIWTEPVDFAAKASNLVTASQALADFSAAGDLSLLMSKAMAVDTACVACHKAFQKRD